MKNKAKELDVDFIGGQNNPLTKEEQLAISAFIKALKDKQSKNSKSKSGNRPSTGKARAASKVLV